MLLISQGPCGFERETGREETTMGMVTEPRRGTTRHRLLVVVRVMAPKPTEDEGDDDAKLL